MRKLQLILLLLLFCLVKGTSQPAPPSDIEAEITSQCLGQNLHQVTLTITKDCDNRKLFPSQLVRYQSSSCGVNAFIELDSVDQVNCMNGKESMIYSVNLLLPAGCGADWILTWMNCCDLNDNPVSAQHLIDNTFTCVEVPSFCQNPISYIKMQTPANCGPNGSATITVNGGSGNYSYRWLDGGQMTSTVNNLYEGTYLVEVIDQVTGCADTTSVTVDLTPSNLYLFMAGLTPESADGANDASLTIQQVGGIGPQFSLAVTPPIPSSPFIGASQFILNNLPSGEYSFIITDLDPMFNCTEELVVNIPTISPLFLPPPAPIPSLSTWGTIILTLLLSIFGITFSLKMEKMRMVGS